MRNRLPRIVILALGICTVGCGGEASYIANSRMSSTATNPSTGTQGTPITMTWSIAPDGTSIPGASSSLINFLDTTFGAGPGGSNLTQRPWFSLLDQSYARLGGLSGVTYLYEAHDDGLMTPFSSAAAGVLGVRGDERLGGKTYGEGNLTLAATFFPDFSEMMVNVDQGVLLGNSSNNYRRLRNTIMHEAMHGLGISHVDSSDSHFLIEPVSDVAFDGPQLDDIFALQRLYGDVLERNGGNDAANKATPMGSLSSGGLLIRGTFGNSTVVDGSAVDFLSIDDESDIDYFSFSLASTLDVTIEATPNGTSYSMGPQNGAQSILNSKALSDLSLALFDSSGVQQLGPTANFNGAGSGEAISRQLTAGTYYARVSGANDDVQLYQLSISGLTAGLQNLMWIGSASSTWDVGASANFNNGTTTAVFHVGNSVTFTDSALTTDVYVAQQVTPSAMHVNALRNYKFSGPGGITVSGLVIEGGSAIELSNTGNVLNGVDIRAGSLSVPVATGASFDGTIRVATGASLSLSGGQSWMATSQLTGGGQVTAPFLIMPGTIAPGNGAGTLTIVGNMALVNSGSISVQLGGLAAGTSYDVLQVNGFASLDGSLDVTLLGAFQPAAGASFSVITAGQLSGTFDAVALPPLAPGLLWQTLYTPTDLILSISSSVAFNPADFNLDGFVDGDDLAAWRTGFGISSGAIHAQGDANGDFAVDATDFLIWQRNVNRTGAATFNSTAVPEPTTWVMLAAAMSAVWAQRRRYSPT